LFDKLFGAGTIATVEVKAKLKMLNPICTASRPKLLGDVTEFLIESTKFDLPAEFLKKWLQTVGEKNYLLRKLRLESF
jgi:trigger factor